MAKGDDVHRRKNNKANRKKLHRNDSSSSSVSARVAAIIAFKKRRKSSKRRHCQGMCFSLPTPADPLNDRHEKKVIKKVMPSRLDERRVFAKEDKSVGRNDTNTNGLELKVEKVSGLKRGRTKTQVSRMGSIPGHQGYDSEILDRPSKYLFMCLNEIDNSLHHDDTSNSMEDKPLFASNWGIEFWRCYSSGMDIIATGGTSSTVEQIAWIACTSADAMSRKDEEDLSCSSPFLLFLVPSHEKATEVRSVCKPLKVHGIHTMSVHSGSPIDHQIQGMKKYEPEFVIATPERLLELVSLKAVDMSEVSLLVIDGVESQYKHGYLHTIKAIMQSISKKTQQLVFTDCLTPRYVHLVQNLLTGPVHRLCQKDSVTSQSACIIQSVKTCAVSDEKLNKAIEVLDNAAGSELCSQPSKVLFILGKDSKFHKLVTSLKNKGYSVPTGSISDFPQVENSVESEDEARPAVLIIEIDQIYTTDLSEFEVVIILDFVLTIDDYVYVLTSMARYTVNGVLHSFLTDEDAELAGPLTEILKRCGQVVPKSLRNMSLTSLMVEP